MGDRSEWENVASTYASQMTESRIQIVFPAILDFLKKQKPHNLLDYGCGSGIFLKDFSSRLGIPQVGFDISDQMASAARDNCRSLKDTAITRDISGHAPNSFDAIVKIAVWMHWKTNEECLSNLQTIRNLIKPTGIFYSVVTHPAFHDRSYSTFSMDLNIQNYLKGGSPYHVRIRDQGISSDLIDYHWPIGMMYSQLQKARFSVREIVEFPDTTPMTNGSPWMLLVAQPH